MLLCQNIILYPFFWLFTLCSETKLYSGSCSKGLWFAIRRNCRICFEFQILCVCFFFFWFRLLLAKQPASDPVYCLQPLYRHRRRARARYRPFSYFTVC